MPVKLSQFGLPSIDFDGEPRVLAALRSKPAELAVRAPFGMAIAVDPSTWQERDLSFLGSPIRNQGRFGSCTGHAGVTAEDISRRQAGQTPVLLSCTFPYGLVNGGRDQGATVTSVLTVLEQVGTCTDAEVGTNMIYQSQFPASAWTTAKNYQTREAYICQSFEELCQSINNGFPVALGLEVGENVFSVGSNGIIPMPDRVVGGHALCGMGLKKDGQGGWYIKVQNSWGPKWGQNGYGYLSKEHFVHMYDGYAIMYVEIINGPPATVSDTHVDPDSVTQPKRLAIKLVKEDSK